MAKTPRGVRNNNPGNIDRSNVAWQGEDRGEWARAAEHRFCVFTTADAGFRALAKTLLTYQRKHRLRTVRQIIGRWAPQTENNTDAYVAAVARAVGVAADQPIDVRKRAVMFALVKAIAHHEQGGDFWPDTTIDRGLDQAGVLA